MSQMMNRRFFLTSSAAALAVLGLPQAARADSLAVQAVAKALAGDFAAAGSVAAQSGDSAAIKFVELLYLRDNAKEAGYARIMAFLKAAPDWPLHETLLKRAEQALYENREPASVVAAHFNGSEPLTAHGDIALARAAFAAGDAASGKKWLREGWIDPDMGSELEAKTHAEFGSSLTADDHRTRMARLIYAQQGSDAERVAKQYLGANEQAMAKVASALIRCEGGAPAKYAALPAAARAQLPMLYVLARWHRKHDDFAKARSILVDVSGDPAAMGDAEAWFEERRSIARRSIGPMQANNWKAAYTIARNHGLRDSDLAVDAEFLAGFIALRYLAQPEMALKHFQKLQGLAAAGSDQARALYWIGRAQKASGKDEAAKASFAAASKHRSVYYGQLAREEIGLGKRPEEISPAGASDAAKAAVEKDEMVRAVRLLGQAGTKAQLNIFMMPLSKRFGDDDKLNAVASIFQDLGGTYAALRFAKSCELSDHELDAWAYPIYGLPNWSQIGKPIEKPLVFALSRQESEFNPDAGSSVGAQGLMQLMPGTARLVAKQFGIAFKPGLLKDASYNVRLGSAHLADLVDTNGGSYILTLIAYNAGPKRVTDWIDYYGDPRSGKVDPVDWVECIPFNETRQYVQKVLQNLHVYRSRLAPETVRPMTADLRRGSSSDGINVGSLSKAQAQCEPKSVAALIQPCG